MNKYYRLEFRPYRIKQNTSKRKKRTFADAIKKLNRMVLLSSTAGRGNYRLQDIMHHDHFLCVL